MLARILACASVAVSPSRPRSRPGGFQTGYVDVFAARLRTALAEVPRRQLRLPWRVDEDVRRPRLPLAGRREATARCLPRNTTRCFARLFATSSRPGERRTIELKRKANPRSHLTRGLISVRPRRRPRSSHQGLENDIARTGETDPLYRSLDETTARVARAARARFADTFPLFNPQGDLTRDKSRIYALTSFCSQREGHPTRTTGRSRRRSGPNLATRNGLGGSLSSSRRHPPCRPVAWPGR